MKLYRIIVLLILVVIFITDYLIGQKKIDNYHFVHSVNNDTVYFVSTLENTILKDSGRACLFILNSTDSNILSTYYFNDAYTFIYDIGDYNNDGINEVLTIDMDEAYYNISIFQVFPEEENITIKKVFCKENLFIPQENIASATENIYNIVKDSAGNIVYIKFFVIESNNKNTNFKIEFDKKKNKFKVK